MLELTRHFPVVVVTGPRQVGKTSLLERCLPDYRYVTLDAPSHAEMAETRPEEFLSRFAPPVMLDEIQYAPSFLRYLKVAVDQRRLPGQFVLTGSQNFALMQQVTESLSGRAAILSMHTLSGIEWRSATELAQHYSWHEFLWRGGYPALWSLLDDSPPRDRWYQSYVTTYLERDVRNIVNVGSLRDFDRFLRACATRCGQSLNMSDLARDVGISHPTAKQWLSVLQSSNQIFLLEPYYRSLGKRLAKSPKMYFTDTGLAAFLMGFESANALWSSAYAGALWENHVIAQWLRWRDTEQPNASLWYWRDQAGNEVDLIVEINQRLYTIECKLSEKPSLRDSSGIERLRDMYGARWAQGYIACQCRQPFDVSPNITAREGWTVWPLGK